VLFGEVAGFCCACGALSCEGGVCFVCSSLTGLAGTLGDGAERVGELVTQERKGSLLDVAGHGVESAGLVALVEEVDEVAAGPSGVV